MRLIERLQALSRAQRQRASEHPPPCVGCRGPRVDQLAPVEAGEIEPSTVESIIGPVADVQAAMVGDQLIALEPSTGHRVLLNASAALIFTAFDDRRELSDVVEQLMRETGMAADELTPDVLATVDRLLAQGMLTRDDLAVSAQRDDSEAADADGDEADDPTIGPRWSLGSGVRDAAGTAVVVRVEPEALAPDVEAALGALPRIDATTSDSHAVRIDIIADGAADGKTVQIVVDGRVRNSHVPSSSVVAHLFDRLDAVLADDTPGLRFHAGAVERDGDVVVVLGQSGHGKSTLTAALVQAGWGYLSDELVAVDAATFDVAPYARPLDLNQYSLDQLGLDGADIVTGSRKDKVFPGRLGRVSAGGRVAAIIVLTGESTEDGQLVTELPAAEAVMAMLALTFAATFDDAGALESLARLCVATPTMRLYRAPIAEMVRAVEGVIASALSSGPIGAVTS